ncbi:CCAAT-binding factor [Tasmannia lanceolata]|uniref:CCAAT-binding factor n=1 Tax=Tasmannia lanceolata TaxID=3420 RepID=UPI00406414D0
MAAETPRKKSKNPNNGDILKSKNPNNGDILKSEVASFASSIGLAPAISSLPSSGFNDSDFRKTGPLKPKTPEKPSKPKPSRNKIPHSKKEETENKKKKNNQARVRALPPHPPPPSHKDQSFETKWNSKKNLPKLPLIKASLLSGQWYVDAAELESKVFGSEGRKIEVRDVEDVKRLVIKKKEIAERLLDQYALDYEASRAKSGDMRMVASAQRSGTAVDKVAAFTCMVEDNPVANLRSLDALLAMVTSKVGKRHALTGFEALRDLFLLRLLPDRKLKGLLQQPLNHLPESKDGFSLLLFWYWEDCLKQRYERFVAALEEASKDMLPILKDKALKTMYALLRSKSEQERRLLSALVNKLGDPERKAASGAGYHLSCLLSAHPNMKAVVIEEVDSFLFRPHLGMRSKYHAVNFLSQILLSSKGDGPKVAKRLMDVYFALFKVLTTEADGGQKMKKNNKKEDKKVVRSLHNSKREGPLQSNVEMDSRLLSALLTGVNRAFPFVASDEADDIIEVQTPIFFKLVHSKNFNVGVQALMLLYQISSKNQIASDRFYRALYSKLLIPAVMISSKPEMFLGLLFKAMKSDVNLKRVSAFSKRLLQVALQQPPQYACGCLFIISEVLKARPHLWAIMLQNESVDEDFEHFEDIIEGSQNIVGTAPSSKPENSDGPINVMTRNNGVKKDGDPSNSEDNEGPPMSDSEEDNSSEGKDTIIGGDNFINVEKFETVSEHEARQAQVPNIGSSSPGGYNPQHREPSYCNADRTSWWELTVLASHVHPSVATMARTLLFGVNIVYNGDPLNDLSLGAFLDKFMEKKPKPNRRSEGIWHGGSQIAPARKLDVSNRLIGADILSLAEEEVPPEDLVFHKFYASKMGSSKKPKKKKKQGGDEDADELFDVDDNPESDSEEIDDMLGLSHLPSDDERDYDYDELDKVAGKEDDDLLGNGSDADMDSPADDYDGGSDGMEDGDDFDNGDDGADGFGKSISKNKKRKIGGRSGASPFASLEDYDHLLNDDGKEKKRSKSSKKLKSTADDYDAGSDGVDEDDDGFVESRSKERRGKKSKSIKKSKSGKKMRKSN